MDKTIIIKNEDHTLGNMLVTQLLHDGAAFAAYSKHPCRNLIELKVKTSDEHLLKKSIENLAKTVKNIDGAFTKAMAARKKNKV